MAYFAKLDTNNIVLTIMAVHNNVLLDENNVSSINLLALLHKKKGDEESAERLYVAAMASSDVNISVLDNYVNLLIKQGKLTEAQDIKSRIENIYDPNPYHWLEKAQLARYKSKSVSIKNNYIN